MSHAMHFKPSKNLLIFYPHLKSFKKYDEEKWSKSTTAGQIDGNAAHIILNSKPSRPLPLGNVANGIIQGHPRHFMMPTHYSPPCCFNVVHLVGFLILCAFKLTKSSSHAFHLHFADRYRTRNAWNEHGDFEPLDETTHRGVMLRLDGRVKIACEIGKSTVVGAKKLAMCSGLPLSI